MEEQCNTTMHPKKKYSEIFILQKNNDRHVIFGQDGPFIFNLMCTMHSLLPKGDNPKFCSDNIKIIDHNI
jgi:hypothetical protein